MAPTVDPRTAGRGRRSRPAPPLPSTSRARQPHMMCFYALASASALALLAVGPANQCGAVAAFPMNASPTAFVTSTRFAPPTKDGMTNRLAYRIASLARPFAFALPMSQNPTDEGDDETFFFRASQLAAQERVARMRDGRDSLAVSLSTSGSGKQATPGTEEDGTTGASSVEESPSPPREEKVPVDPFQLKQRQQQEEETKAKSMRGNDDFQRRLLEARLLMNAKATSIGSEDKDGEKILDEETKLDEPQTEPVPPMMIQSGMTAEEAEQVREARLAEASGEVVEAPPAKDVDADAHPIAEGSTAEEAEATRLRRTDEADEVAKTLQDVEDAEDAVSLSEVDYEGIMGDVAETISAGDTSGGISDDDASSQSKEEASAIVPDAEESGSTAPRLSSDGKEIFEPSPEALEIDQENVEKGLLTLTRSMFALMSILEKRQGQ